MGRCSWFYPWSCYDFMDQQTIVYRIEEFYRLRKIYGSPERSTGNTVSLLYRIRNLKKQIASSVRRRLSPGSFEAMAWRFGTDKCKYAFGYESLFPYEMRLSVKKVLELGIWRGASLWLWNEFFPDARLTGIDSRVEKWIEFPKSAVLIEGKQEDDKIIADLKRRGPWDIIIDDAGHYFPEQIICFEGLRESASIYIIEDIPIKEIPLWDTPSKIFYSTETEEAMLIYEKQSRPS